MAITRQNIVDAYNSIYFSVNNVNKTYAELATDEKVEGLLILLNNNGGSGGGGGGGITQAEVEAAIEAASNLDGLESSLNDIRTHLYSNLPNLINNRLPVNAESSGLSTMISFGVNSAENVDEIATNTAQIGARGEGAASTDTGFAGIIPLMKRLLSVKLPDAINNRIQTESKSYRPNIVETPILEASLTVNDTTTTRGVLSSRTRIAISNTGTNPVYVDVTSSITTTKYLFLLQPNDFYFDDFHYGFYYFRCATGLSTTVQIREWQ